MAEILVIDDEESIRYTFASFLSEEGHWVTTAGNYAEGAARISETNFDLIFSDIILGGRTGIDLLREARERKLICPVVMITGHPTMETAVEAVRLGAFDYLSKPVEQDALLHITRLALAHKNVLDENERYRAHLDAVFRSVEDGILSVDKELRVVEMNAAAARLCGLTRDDIGRDTASSSMCCKARLSEALKETVEGKKSVRMERFECAHDERTVKVLTVSTFPLIDRQGLFTGAVAVLRDETRLASLEEDLEQRRRFHNIVGVSERMQKVYSLIGSLADVETTVLITGESGTGKELAAEALHFMGGRRDRPLVKVNCSTLSENLLESELFGHVKGAFTGAVSDRIGRFQKADGGSIFLDEIGDISPRVQSSLLRVLQEKEFERVGDSKPVKVDVRVIAATNKDLQEKVKRGEFREDLYYRLKVVELPLPPLRDRKEDIPLMVEHYLKHFKEKFHKEIPAVSADVENIFMNYPWPGNVRELKHALEHAYILCRADTITADLLPLHLSALKETGDASRRERECIDAQTILRTLDKTAWNKARAARLLGVDRKTLYRSIEKYNISR
jgi:PAS domain S-box-containing protein